MLTFQLKQNHGGWNSDDNQNNNLGRFRFSVTDGRTAVADPLPSAVRDILAILRERRTPAQTEAVFAYWRTTGRRVEGRQRRDRAAVAGASGRHVAADDGGTAGAAARRTC